MDQQQQGDNDNTYNNNDDTGSVSSQSSRRSERLLAKRSREDEPVSPGPPVRRQRRGSTTTGTTSTPGSSRRRRASGEPMELTTIPEAIVTTTNAPLTGPLQQQPQPHETPPQAPPVKPAAAAVIAPPRLPPVTPARLQPSAPAFSSSTIAAAAAVLPLKSSKKLLSLDTKIDTPFKKRHQGIGNDDDDREDEKELPEAQAPFVPNVPRHDEPPTHRLQQVWNHYSYRLETLRFWLLLFLLLQIVFYPITIHPILSGTASLSRHLLTWYQSMLVTPLPDLMPLLQQLQDDLVKVHDQEKQAIRVLKHKRTELQTVVSEYVAQNQAKLATFQASLPDVVNLSRPVFWTTSDDDCSTAAVDDDSGGGGAVMSVAQAATTIRQEYQAQMDDWMQESDVPGWVRQQLPSQSVDRNLVRLQQSITKRMEQEIADFDYTDTVIHSTGNFVDSLPWGNRLLALWGLRFYGHDAPAAIMPTTPRSLGQCWALTTPATMTIQLSQRIHVQSVSMDHPGVAPESSAIRSFSVYAIDANQRLWPLGNFSYNNNNNKQSSEGHGRQDFMVRDTYMDEEIPPVKVVKVMVDSSWGAGDYACLYRFRVFGEEEDWKEEE